MAIHCDNIDEIKQRNDETRDLAAAYRDCNGTAWLGRFVPGARPILQEWAGSTLKDINADFVLQRHDQVIEEMIASQATLALKEAFDPGRWYEAWRARREEIHRRIRLLGGLMLHWYYYDEEEARRRHERVRVEFVELWEDRTWTIVALEVPRHVAETESHEALRDWYLVHVTLPVGAEGILVWDFKPEGAGLDNATGGPTPGGG